LPSSYFHAGVIALLVDPVSECSPYRWKRTGSGAREGAASHRASSEGDRRRFAALVQQHASGLVISGDTFFASQLAQLVALASRHAVPTI
jgi:hypothetical protein